MSIGFGVDTWCGASRITGRLSRGNQTLALALFRRYTTTRGQLTGSPEAEVYGFDVAGFVGHVGYERAIGAIPSMMAAEGRKDDRVADVFVEVAKTVDARGDITLDIAVHVTPRDGSEDFTLTMSVSDAGAVLTGALPEAA